MILDTSFLIDLMDENQGAVMAAQTLENESDAPQRIPAQVVYELYVGVGMSDTPTEEWYQIQGVIDSRPVVETTEQIAKLAGRVDGELRKEGHRVPASDVIIGATARHFDEPVVTSNIEDFERIPGVEVMDYNES